MNSYYVYIMASSSDVLYIGVTNDLQRRISEHKKGLVEGFTKRYNCHRLVYYEDFSDIKQAIVREKYLKGKIDVAIVNTDISKLGPNAVAVDIDELKIEIVQAPLVSDTLFYNSDADTVVRSKYRHDPEKLGKIIYQLVK